jgi:hypothetical protein
MHLGNRLDPDTEAAILAQIHERLPTGKHG